MDVEFRPPPFIALGLVLSQQSDGPFRRVGLYRDGMSSQDADTNWDIFGWEIGVIIIV
jgi:hypothetical protein